MHEKRDNPPPPVLTSPIKDKFYLAQSPDMIELDIDLACEVMGKLCEWIIEKVKVEVEKDDK